MKIDKKTKVTYSLDEKELSKIILKSMRLREELVSSIVFITGGLGTRERELKMEITMSYTDDVSGV